MGSFCALLHPILALIIRCLGSSVYKPSLLRSWHLPLEGEVQSSVKSDALNAVDAIAHHAGLGVSPEEGIKKNIWIRDLILEAGNEE